MLANSLVNGPEYVFVFWRLLLEFDLKIKIFFF